MTGEEGKSVASGVVFSTMRSMKYRRFGKTNLQMPVFSCGGMRFQQSWDDLPAEKVEESVQRNLEATVLRALELGINHIETARGYGTSEMQLGWILPKLPRDKMIVQTKVEPMADPAQFRRRLNPPRLQHGRGPQRAVNIFDQQPLQFLHPQPRALIARFNFGQKTCSQMRTIGIGRRMGGHSRGIVQDIL